MKIAIVGTGIAGNVAAHRLHRAHDITVYEAAGHIGGHTHTHRIELDGEVQQVDTGFIVFNDRTYPHFVALLDELGVASHASAMSFWVRNERSGLEYNGTTLNTCSRSAATCCGRRSCAWCATSCASTARRRALLDGEAGEIALGDYLAAQRYSRRSSTTTWCRWARRSGRPTRSAC